MEFKKDIKAYGKNTNFVGLLYSTYSMNFLKCVCSGSEAMTVYLCSGLPKILMSDEMYCLGNLMMVLVPLIRIRSTKIIHIF